MSIVSNKEMLTVEAVGKKRENYDFLNDNLPTKKANPKAFKKMYVNGSEIGLNFAYEISDPRLQAGNGSESEKNCSPTSL